VEAKLADYLQDLLDRTEAYTDPSQYPAMAFDPTMTDEENKKKKKGIAPVQQPALPPWLTQAGALLPGMPVQGGPAPAVDPRNPLGIYGPSETGANPIAAAIGANLQRFGGAQPPPPPPAPPAPIQTSAALTPDETGAPQVSLPPVNTNPLGTYGPEETGTSPIGAKLAANLKKFSEAKREKALTPPETWSAVPPATAPPPAPPPGALSSPLSAAAAAGTPAPVPPTPPPDVLASSPQSAAAAAGQPSADWQKAGMLAGGLTPSQEKVPLPRERPTGAPQREPSGDTSANLPQTATPAQGGQPSFLDRAGMLPGGGGGIGDVFSKIMGGLGQHSNLLLAMGAGLMGAPNVWQGLGRGFSYAGPAAQQDIKQQQMLGQQQAVYKALVGAGAPANMAQAATLDPDIKKQMLQTYIADKGYEIKPVESTNFIGQKVTDYWAINKFNPQQSFKISPGAEGGGPAGPVGAAGGGAPGAAGAPGGKLGPPIQATQDQINALGQIPENYDQKTGKDEGFMQALRQVDPTTADSVQGMAEGRIPPRGKNSDILMRLAQRYENNFDATTFRQRQDLRDSYFGKGEGYNGLLAANTAIHHGVQMQKAIEDLHNLSVLPGFLNKATGLVSAQYNQRYQTALANFKAARTDFSEEMEKALTGKSTRGGQKDFQEGFDEYGSPATNMATLQKHLGNLKGRIDEREIAYRNGMKMQGGDFFPDMLTNRPALERMLQGGPPEGQPAARPPAGPAKIPPGSHVVVDKNGNIQSVSAPQ
jgi:hypothetical protein